MDPTRGKFYFSSQDLVKWHNSTSRLRTDGPPPEKGKMDGVGGVPGEGEGEPFSGKRQEVTKLA